jgi:ATP-dependent DNA helicase RecQ
LSVYGIGKSRPTAEWRSLARSLLHQRLVEESQDGYSVLSLNDSSWQILRSERSFGLAKVAKVARAQGAGSADRSRTPTPAAADSSGDALFERLRSLRKQLADSQGLPPYVIFHDATLREMVARKPRTLGQFAGIRGVGEGKLQRYGQQFIDALREPS